jgi:enoyl-CoA hydratase/carnithine racemase
VTFAFTESRLGLSLVVVALTVLPRITSRAASLSILGGEVFSADEAARIGLVSETMADAELDHRTRAILASVVAADPE